MTPPAAAGLAPSFGFGDRLGLATPGHVAAVRAAAGTIVPVYAQQSARELRRTGRSWSDVLAAARAGATAAGWDRPYGADADHCKELADVISARDCGFTMFTLDPSERIGATVADDDVEDAVRAHDLREPDVVRRWLPAVAHAATLAAEVPAGADIELSIDETAEATTPAEHAFVAAELRRRGVTLTSLAPRFPGSFEKGIDHRGSLDDFVRAVREHAHVARTYGPYKLSLHSGSDKLRLYAPFAKETGGLFHVKTAGTSYLEALRVAGRAAPALLRRIWELAAERFATDRATYDTTAEVAAVPPAIVRDEPVRLLDDEHARRVLHVTFGSVLSDPDLSGELLAVLEGDGGAAYAEALERHFVAHLRPLAG